MVNHAYFHVNRLALMKVMSQVKASIGRNKCDCELTITNGLVSFNVPGATFAVDARTRGSAKAAFEFKTFRQILKTYDETVLRIQILDGLVIIENFEFLAATTFFEDDTILRSIVLPMNFTDLDLISIAVRDRYTEEELEFNNVSVLLYQVAARLRKNLATAARALKPYGIKRVEIENLINKKIQLLVDSHDKALNIQKLLQDKDSEVS